MNPTTAIADSVARLTAAGAHLVLCRPDKRPLWRGWQRRWPGADTARAHLNSEKGPLGVVPASLRSTALDVDTGDPLHLFGEYPPWADIPSRRGHHAYYDDDRSRGNSTWALHGCGGDIRSGRGFLVLHKDGHEHLSDALERRTFGEHRLPRDLFELAGYAPVLRETQPRSRAADIAPQPAVAAPITINLELTRIGHRNISLFNVVRTWAYVQPKPRTIEAWAATVLKYGREQNRRFRDPLLPDEVGMLSWNVASWTWNGGGAIDHGIMAQSRRGLVSAAVRRYRTYDRDRFIVARLDAGDRQAEVARAFGVSQATVSLTRGRLERRRREPKNYVFI